MTENTSTLQSIPEATTPAALHEAHERLLERREKHEDDQLGGRRELAANGHDEILDHARQLIAQGRELGRLLREPNARFECQSVLNYWAVYLYRAKKEEVEAHLRPYDPLTAPELNCPCPYRFGGDEPTPLELSGGWQRLIDQAVQSLVKEGLTTVAGSAGSGRHLFVDRVLLPRLKQGGDGRSRIPENSNQWRYLEVDAEEERPLSHLIAAIRGLPAGQRPDSKLVGEIRRSPLRIAEFDEQSPPTVLVIHNLERALQQDEERKAFVEALAELIARQDVPHGVLATLRRDGVVRLSQLGPLEIRFRQTQLPLSFTSGELKQFIEDPAEQVGLIFDPGVVDRIINDLQGESTLLPLLQFTMARLWQRRDRNRITREAYQEAGAGRVALEMEAEAVWRDLESDEQTLRDLLQRLVQFEIGGVVTARVVPRSELADAIPDRDALDRVLQRLEASDLIQRQETNGRTAYKIRHYALLTSWPRLIEWLEQWRFDNRLSLQLSSAAKQWGEEQKRDPGLLWRGAAIAEAREKLESAKLPPLEREFLDESWRCDQRTRLLVKLAAGVLATTAAIVLGIFLWLTHLRNIALEQRNIALEKTSEALEQKSEALTQKAEETRQKNVALEERNAIEIRNNALQRAARDMQDWNSILPVMQERSQENDPTGEALLLTSRQELAEKIREVNCDFTGQLAAGAAADDWRRGLAQTQFPQLNWIWLGYFKQKSPPEASDQPVLSFQSLHPLADGRRVIVRLGLAEGKESQVWILDTQSPKPKEIPALQAARDVAVDTIGGRQYLLAAEGDALRIAPLDMEFTTDFKFDELQGDGRPLADVARVFVGPEGRIATVQYSRLETEGKLQLWNLESSGQSLVPFKAFAVEGQFTNALRDIKLAEFSPSGRWLLTVGHDPDTGDTLQLWDLKSGIAADPLPLQTLSKHWSPIYVESGDQRAAGWIHDHQLLAVAFAPAAEGESESAFTTASSSGAVEFWTIAQQNPDESARVGLKPTAPILHKGDVYGMSYAAQGRYLITASRDRTVRTWYADSGLEAIAPLFHEATVNQAIVVGKQLLTVSGNAVRSWRVDRFAGSLMNLETGGDVLSARATTDFLSVPTEDGRKEVPLYRHLALEKGRVEHVKLDERGRRLFLAVTNASGPNPELQRQMIVLDALDLKPVARSEWDYRLKAVAFPPQGGSLVFADDKGLVHWPLQGGGKPERPVFWSSEANSGAIESLAWSPDGSWLAAGGFVKESQERRIGRVWLGSLAGRDGTIEELKPLCGSQSQRFPERVLFLGGSTYRGHAYLITGEASNQTQILRAPASECEGPAFKHTSDVVIAAGKPGRDGLFRLVTVGSSGDFKLWQFNPETMSSNRPPQPHAVLTHGGKVDCAVFSPDGELVITAGQDGLIRLWHFASKESVGTLRPGRAVSDMRFVSPNVLLTVARRGSSQEREGSPTSNRPRDAQREEPEALAVRLWQIEPVEHFQANQAHRELLAGRSLVNLAISPLTDDLRRWTPDGLEEQPVNQQKYGRLYRFTDGN